VKVHLRSLTCVDLIYKNSRVLQENISFHKAAIFCKHCQGTDYSQYHEVVLLRFTTNTNSSVSEYLRGFITQGNYK